MRDGRTAEFTQCREKEGTETKRCLQDAARTRTRDPKGKDTVVRTGDEAGGETKTTGTSVWRTRSEKEPRTRRGDPDTYPGAGKRKHRNPGQSGALGAETASLDEQEAKIGGGTCLVRTLAVPPSDEWRK